MGSEIYELKEAILPAIYILKSHETFNTESGCLHRSTCVVVSKYICTRLSYYYNINSKDKIWSRSRDLKLGSCDLDSKTPHNPTEKT